MSISNLTVAEYEAIRNKAILKYSSLSYKTVVEDIYRLRPTVNQQRVDTVWACLYVINLYDPEASTNYITEREFLNIADIINRA